MNVKPISKTTGPSDTSSSGIIESKPRGGAFPYSTIGIFPHFADVGEALLILEGAGFSNHQISVLGREQEHWQEKLKDEWETLKVTKGALQGAALGALPGLAIVAGIALTGGVGALVAGPMVAGMSALGMGAAVGSLMGGASPTLKGPPLTVEEELTEAIAHGQWVVVVHCHTEEEALRAQALLPNRRSDPESESRTSEAPDRAAAPSHTDH